MVKTIGKAAVKTRLRRIKDIREQTKLEVNELHVRLQRGNRKTGVNCWTVSLLPIIDCDNCNECIWNCYDFKNDLMYKQTIFDRCRNSVIHEVDRETVVVVGEDLLLLRQSHGLGFSQHANQ